VSCIDEMIAIGSCGVCVVNSQTYLVSVGKSGQPSRSAVQTRRAAGGLSSPPTLGRWPHRSKPTIGQERIALITAWRLRRRSGRPCDELQLLGHLGQLVVAFGYRHHLLTRAFVSEGFSCLPRLRRAFQPVSGIVEIGHV